MLSALTLLRMQAMLLQQVQRQLAVYQESRKTASDEIARLTASNISLSTELEIVKLQHGDLTRKIAELKVRVYGNNQSIHLSINSLFEGMVHLHVLIAAAPCSTWELGCKTVVFPHKSHHQRSRHGSNL